MDTQFQEGIIASLRCPKSGSTLTLKKGLIPSNTFFLMSADGSQCYSINQDGIPLFAKEYLSDDAKAQQIHYDKIAARFIENLSYAHTVEYMKYLDEMLHDSLGNTSLKQVAEVCCGGGEIPRLYVDHIDKYYGIDISEQMLISARQAFPNRNCTFIQGDATALPLADEHFDTVFMLGGIHHVNNRDKLFSEIFRILKPGGNFVWREPVSDFFLWRWIRNIIYKLSPALDDKTEAPLLYNETVPVLINNGFVLKQWKTFGFFGFCLFMNSDVLVFNRVFRFIPGIRAITRAFSRIDHVTTNLKGMQQNGLIVIGRAQKPFNS